MAPEGWLFFATTNDYPVLTTTIKHWTENGMVCTDAKNNQCTRTPRYLRRTGYDAPLNDGVASDDTVPAAMLTLDGAIDFLLAKAVASATSETECVDAVSRDTATASILRLAP